MFEIPCLPLDFSWDFGILSLLSSFRVFWDEADLWRFLSLVWMSGSSASAPSRRTKSF